MEFQKNYSRLFPAVKDESVRRRKSQKILRAFQDHWQRDRLEGLVGLDLGCSLGMISRALSEAGARMYGIDIDWEALSLIPASWREGTGFMVGDACSTPFKPGSFDLIICSQVYEHSPSLTRLAGEIFRLLKKGGVCFFSGPNKWAIMEGHYHRPFLSWLPRKWADSWVRSRGLGDGYYEKPVSAKKLRKALQAFIIRDLTPDLIKYPERYALGEEVGRWRYLSRIVPAPGWFLLGRVVPNFNWLLMKPTR